MALTDVISYGGDNKTFIWKYPSDTINYGSTVIVSESQEAVFMLNGEVIEVYKAGKHVVESESFPVAKGLARFTHGGRVPTKAEVYFVNKFEQMAIRWGTDSKVQYMDPEYNFPLEIGACGEMSLSVENSMKLLLKIVGTMTEFSQETVNDFFRAFIMNRVKTALASLIVENNINIFNLDMHLTFLSDEIKKLLETDFIEYGINLNKFLIMTILKPDDDKNFKKFKELHFRRHTEISEAKLQQELGIIEENTKAQRRIIEAEAVARQRQTEGYTYQQERGFDVAKEIAKNEAIGQVSNLGLGLGVMAGVSGTVAGTVGMATNQALQGAINQNQQSTA